MRTIAVMTAPRMASAAIDALRSQPFDTPSNPSDEIVNTATSTGPDFRSGPITATAAGTPNVEIVLGPS